MDIDTLSILAAAIIVAAGFIWGMKQGRPVTQEGILATIETLEPTAIQVQSVALAGAQMVEQLRTQGKITPGTELQVAMEYVQDWFPSIDPELIEKAVEAGVFVVNLATDVTKPDEPNFPPFNP